MKIKNFFEKHLLISLIIVALFFGLGGGIIGGIIGLTYLEDFPYDLFMFGNLDFSSDRYRDQGIIIGNARNVIVEQDDKIDETINSAGAGLAGIYKKQKPVSPEDVFSLDNFYKISDSAGQGFIITSDGWLVTGLALDKTFDDYVVITADKKIYPIDKAVADNLTKFYFIHVPARDLPVRKFAEKRDIKRGSLAVSVNWQGASWVSTVAGFSQGGGLIKSSDDFSEKLVLNDKIPAELKGSVIFNLAGDALGLADNQGAIEPISHFNSASKGLFKNKEVLRPGLGVNYVDLSRLVEIGGQHSYWRQGAIIHKDAKGVAVRKNSPAESGGLRPGDIIISINDVSLNKDNDLADIIQNYVAGDKIFLLYSRGNEEKRIEVILEALQ